ncbi:MAG TPA: FRG domain-containing protein [Stenomitos sp.]
MSSEVEVEFDSWEGLVSYFASADDFPGWVFRGLSSSSYSLHSKLERSLQDAEIPESEWKYRERSGFAFFKERATLFLSNTPDDEDILGWMSFMQHYGAPTRLTDWTMSPFVACFFAYEKARKDDGKAALWMLNAGACRVQKIGTYFPFGPDYLGVIPSQHYSVDGSTETMPGCVVTDKDVSISENNLLRRAITEEWTYPLPLSILRPDRRMLAQQACFVCNAKLSGKEEKTPVELLMNEALPPEFNNLLEKVPKELLNPPKVKKISLPNRWRKQALESLAKMNITADTLFPGLDGLGRTTEIHMQLYIPPLPRDYLGL